MEIAFNFQRVPLSVLVCDLDNFKTVNDTLGYAAGNDALKDFARILAAPVQKIGTAYRFGGDEFVALLHGVDAGTAATIAERLRADVEEHFKAAPGLAGLEQRSTTTIAHSTFEKREYPEVVFRRVADVLQQAKRDKKRNRVHEV